MKRVLACAIACTLVIVTGAYGGIVSAPVDFTGPGNSLTASGTVLGSLSVSGSGGMYTWSDGVGWVGETFTIPSQAVAIQTNPALVLLSSSPTGSMTLAIDDGTFAIDSFFDVSVDLANGGLGFDMAPATINVNLDAGGSTTIDLSGSGAFDPVIWNGPTSVLAGAMVDVSASAGPIPLGYLFNASVQQTLANNVATSFTIDPGVGEWYQFGVHLDASFENIALDISDSGSLVLNTYSGSQYPYYALTLDYDLTGCCAGLCDVEVSLNGVGEIPEPTTLALLALAPAALRLRRRR